MALVRHGQGRRLPRRPGRCRGHVPRRGRDDHQPRAPGPAVRPHARRAHQPAPLRRAHPQLRRGPGAAQLLRRRPDRARHPPDPLPAVHPARRRPSSTSTRSLDLALPDGRRPRERRRRLQIATTELHAFRARAVLFATGGYGRSSRSPRTPTPSPATAMAIPSAGACRWRTWSSSSSTRPDVQARLPALRGDARRGRLSRQRRRRALHGALRADHEGPRLAPARASGWRCRRAGSSSTSPTPRARSGRPPTSRSRPTRSCGCASSSRR